MEGRKCLSIRRMQRRTRPLAIACLALATLVVTADAWAARPRPITHEDVWLMKRVGQPALSPDGKSVVFSVIDPGYDEKEQWSDLWLYGDRKSVV